MGDADAVCIGPTRPAGPCRAVAVLLALLFALAGCELSAQKGPRSITPGPPSDGTPLPSVRRSPAVVHVYLLRDEQLVAVARSGHTAQDALNQLSAGPTRGEATAGIGTALPPQPLMLVPDHQPGTAVVDVTDAFVALAGRRQVLAVAQLVWTVTDLCCFREVQVRLDGRWVALPTDTGTTVGPVARTDYTSVVPEPG